jgi:hypothetical protein
MGHSGVAEQLLASWEEGTTTPSHTPVAGVDASLGLTSAADTYAAGSIDGTYGSFGSGASVISNSFRIQTAETFTLTVNNNSVSNLNLAAIRFDFARRFNGSPELLSVAYESGDLGAGPVVFLSESVDKFGSDSGDYPDFDVLLSPTLADTELAPLESAVFAVAISGGSGSRSMLDNLAVTGDAITSGTVPQVSVTINPSNEKWTISPYLVGAHTVYYNDKDVAYSDDSFALWCKQAGVSTMRFPGGSVVKYWDWQTPSGTATGDPWDPAWDGIVAPAADWMSIDEYLHFCDVSGITPLVGVNYRSGYLYNRMQDSIDRASNCVQYVVDAGYPGAFYYIGNEDMFQVGGVYSSATNFIAHAAAMKTVDPTLRIFWNDNGADPNQMKNWLGAMHADQTTYPGKAGDYADGYEFHGKWPFGGDPDPSPPLGTYSNWLTEVPLRDYKSGPDPDPLTSDPNDWGKTWREKIAVLRAAAVEAGYPDLLMANNEYGWGKGSHFSGFDKFTSGLLQIDFLQEHFISNYDMTAFWANIRGADTGLLDKSDNYKRNPQTLGWELLADAQSATMVESDSSHPYVYGFSAKTPTNMYVFLLNKTESSQEVEFTFSAMPPDETQTPEGLSVVDTVDHFGTVTPLIVTYIAASNAYYATLPALSYNRVDFGALPAVSAYDQWALLYSLTNGPSGNDDNDALNNLYEYGLGGDPTNPADLGILPTFGKSGTVFEYIYPRRTATNSGVAYYLELTDDLVAGTWTNSGYSVSGSGSIDVDFEAVTNELTTAGKTNEFIRLKIIQN